MTPYSRKSSNIPEEYLVQPLPTALPANDFCGCLTPGNSQTGATGAAGTQGIQGPQGIQGLQGANGQQGIQGETGAQGAIGIQGPTGQQGIKGDPGQQGVQGIQGEQGEQGLQGVAGADGAAGATGVGVPVGGSPGQVLAKVDETDFNTAWINPPAGGGSGLLTAETSGTNDYTATITPAITAYNATQVFSLLFTNSNTGPCTLNLNNLGIVSLKKNGSFELSPGDLIENSVIVIAYDGTNFQVAGNISGVLPTISSGEKFLTVTASGGQLNYDAADEVIDGTALTAADFSTGTANVPGLQGQKANDVNYYYICIGENQWTRLLKIDSAVYLSLGNIDDSAGDQTSAQLNTAYPNAEQSQQLFGVNKLYIKKDGTTWVKISLTIA